MPIVLGHELNTKKIQFSAVQKNEYNQGKTVYLNYDSIRDPHGFKIQTPVMTLPYDMSNFEDKNFSIELSFRDVDTNEKVKGYHKNMEKLEQSIIEECNKNYKSWLQLSDKDGKGKKMKKEVLEEIIASRFTPIIRKSKDKETGEHDGKYPDTIKLKLPFWEGKPRFTVSHLKKGEELKTTEPKELFVKGSRVKAILKCNIWLVSGKFGCTMKIDKVAVDAPESISGGYSFIDDSDQEDGDDNSSKDNSKVDDTDDDDDDEEEDDSDEDESDDED